MIDLAREIIGTQPILTVFLAIGLGYLVGQINIFGFSLGVGAVLFVGLALGAFAPKAQIVGPIGLTGLIMFLYAHRNSVWPTIFRRDERRRPKIQSAGAGRVRRKPSGRPRSRPALRNQNQVTRSAFTPDR